MPHGAGTRGEEGATNRELSLFGKNICSARHASEQMYLVLDRTGVVVYPLT